MLALQAQGRSVTTVEGLARDGKLHALQEAFIDCHGLQCGFCTPGMLMAAAGLLARNPRPSEAEIVEALEGNLCRCTGYVNIVAAVQQAAETHGRRDKGATHERFDPQAGRFGSGQTVRRIEDPALVAGRGRFTDDLSLPGQAHLVFLRSPYAHARIVSIDAGAARGDARRARRSSPAPTSCRPACKPLAARDAVPAPRRQARLPRAPRRALAHETVRYVGEAVAAVVAESARRRKATPPRR